MTVYERESLVGRWFRQETDEQGNQLIEFAEFSVDGSFEFCFTTQTQQGEIIETIAELGDWGLVADIHFTITKGEVVDGKMYGADLDNSENYQAYKVLELTPEYFQYQHMLTHESYTLKRVTELIGHC